jgi:hypothetical protein
VNDQQIKEPDLVCIFWLSLVTIIIYLMISYNTSHIFFLLLLFFNLVDGPVIGIFFFLIDHSGLKPGTNQRQTSFFFLRQVLPVPPKLILNSGTSCHCLPSAGITSHIFISFVITLKPNGSPSCCRRRNWGSQESLFYPITSVSHCKMGRAASWEGHFLR